MIASVAVTENEFNIIFLFGFVFTLNIFLFGLMITFTQACLKALSNVSNGLFHKEHHQQ
jgi:hypothetical protein